jgi:hypothetical protein
MRIQLVESMPGPLAADLTDRQNLNTLPMSIVVLATSDNLLPSFRRLAPRLLTTSLALPPRTLVELRA